MAHGVPDEVFWDSTIAETVDLMGKIAQRDEARERAAALRAALIASEIHNANRVNSQGRRLYYRQSVEAGDYIARRVQYVDGETLRGLVHDWIGKGQVKQ